MTSLRNVLGFLMATLLVAFTLPAIAHYDDEKFSLKMAPTAVAGTYTATIKNLSDDDDKIKSFKITVPTTPPGVGITSASTTYAGAIVTNAGGVVSVKNVAIKKGQSIVVTLAGVTFPATDSCGPTNFTWGAKAWESSTWSGEQFDLDVSKSTLVTPVTGTCSMVFVTQPTSTLSGGLLGTAANPVSVQGTPGNAFAGKTITLTIATSPPPGSPPLAIAGNTATADSTGLAKFPNVSVTGPTGGGYSLKASTNLTGFPEATSSTFSIGDSDGVVDCQGSPNGAPNQITQGQFTALRGLNKNLSVCKLVQVDYIEIGDREYEFKWDVNNQEASVFRQTRLWPPRNGNDVPVVQVKWGSLEYRPALSCLTPDLPLPYGVASYSAGVITLGGTPPLGVSSFLIPPVGVAFDWVIGPERMTMNCSSETSCSIVNRQVGGTPLADLTAPGQYAMSTSFPMIGNEIQYMCLQSLEVESLPSDECSPELPRTACQRLKTIAHDGGDGKMSY